MVSPTLISSSYLADLYTVIFPIVIFLLEHTSVGNLSCAIRSFFVPDEEGEPGTGQILITFIA